VLGSFNPWTGSLDGVEPLFPQKRHILQKALRRNRALGRKILLVIARHQKQFMDQSFLLGDEGGVFDQLCHSLAAMVYALSLDQPQPEYLLVAAALDLEADLVIRGKRPSPRLQSQWAEIGRLMMDERAKLHQDLIADIEVSDIPLDPRFVERYI
jgi:hypothetical protein